VNSKTLWQDAYPADYRSGQNGISRPDRSERRNPLGPGAALIIVLLSSLGLWGVIWLAVSPLASALL
jgi:hypothetical protein